MEIKLWLLQLEILTLIKTKIEVVAGLEVQFIISAGTSAVSIQVTTAPV